MDYEGYFRLNTEPFANVPDTRFFYNSRQHKMALLRMIHSAERMRGFALLVGQVGTGKTTVSRKLLSYLSAKEEFKTGMIVLTHEDFTEEWLYSRIGRMVGIKDEDKISKDPMKAITSQLLKLDRAGKKTVLIIDEANKISDARVIEQIRGFLNLELKDRRIITFILVGVPELEEHLNQNESITQRIATRAYLKPLTREQTEGYIKHRLNVAGADAGLFTNRAIDAIFNYSGGRPRLINNICDNALLEAAYLEQMPINADMTEEVCESIGLKKQLTSYQREL
ncbi:MAG: AAA family ATPase [bacterium]